MYAEYKRDMSHNYLILHGENPVDTSSYQVRMLTGNAVPSILKCRIQGLDGKFLFYYDITSRQSLASFYEQKKLQVSDIRLIFGGVVKIMEEMMEFLLNPDQLLLSPEYMYLDVEKQKILYHDIGEAYRGLDNWSMYLITAYDQAERYIGKKATKNRKIYNGMMRTYFYQYLGPKPPRKKEL